MKKSLSNPFRNGTRAACFGLAVVTIGSVLVLAVKQGETAQAEPVMAVEQQAVKVRVVRPGMATVPRYLQETGRVEAVRDVPIIARATGTLTSVAYEDGKKVQEGQVLFTIEPDQYQAKVDQAEARVMEAQASLDNAQRQFKRDSYLVTTSSVSQASLDDATAARDSAEAQLAAAKADLALAQIDLGYTTIKAPFDGYVTAHQVDEGALVEAQAGTELARIVTLDQVCVSFTISELQLLRIRNALGNKSHRNGEGLKSIVVEAGTQVDEGYPLKGYLDYAAPETDPNTGTLTVRAVFDNKDRALLPGMYVRVRIAGKPVENALQVPVSAVGTDQLGRYVLAVGGDGAVERRSVTLLQKSGDLQPVEGELSAEDRILLNVLSGVSAGQIVTPEEIVLPGAKPAAAQSAEASGKGS